jgi:hypothetical protein
MYIVYMLSSPKGFGKHATPSSGIGLSAESRLRLKKYSRGTEKDPRFYYSVIESVVFS